MEIYAAVAAAVPVGASFVAEKNAAAVGDAVEEIVAATFAVDQHRRRALIVNLLG